MSLGFGRQRHGPSPQPATEAEHTHDRKSAMHLPSKPPQHMLGCAFQAMHPCPLPHLPTAIRVLAHRE